MFDRYAERLETRKKGWEESSGEQALQNRHATTKEKLGRGKGKEKEIAC